MLKLLQNIDVAKLRYAVSAWWDFATGTDPLTPHYGRGIHIGFCVADVSTAAEMIDNADNVLMTRILASSNHISHQLFPESSHRR